MPRRLRLRRGLAVALWSTFYGTLGGLVALLVWFWITNLAILFGHQLNAEIEEGRPRAEQEIQLEPRSEPKKRKTA